MTHFETIIKYVYFKYQFMKNNLLQEELHHYKMEIFSTRNYVVCSHDSLYMVFTVRLHVMQRMVLLSEFCLSVRLFVRPSDACIVTKLNNALRIF